MQDSRARGRRTLLIVAAIFLLPVAAAFTLYYGKLWRQRTPPARGLIEPAQPLNVAGLRHADGSPAAPAVLAGKWTLLYIGDGRCDEVNVRRIYRQSAWPSTRDDASARASATGNRCDTEYFAASRRGSSRSMRLPPKRLHCWRSFPASAKARCTSSIRSAT
jgi:hypothetical protein